MKTLAFISGPVALLPVRLIGWFGFPFTYFLSSNP
jgi:hypothetical protein